MHGRRQWHPTPVLLPGKSHGRRSLIGCSPWGRWGSDMTEWLHFHFSSSCFGEGTGNPLQSSCLENPRDGGTWWAAIYGVAQSQTWLKRLSSSNVCLGVCASTVGVPGSTPGQGTKIPEVVQPDQKKEKEIVNSNDRNVVPLDRKIYIYVQNKYI